MIFSSSLYLLLWQLISGLMSPLLGASMLAFTKYLFFFSLFSFTYYFLLRNFKPRYLKLFLKSFLEGFLIFISLCSIYGIFQFFNSCEQFAKWDDPEFFGSSIRIYSIFLNPNLFGTLVLMALPINFFFLDFNKLLKYTFLFINLTALFLTGSRSAMLSLFCVLVIMLFFLLAKRNFKPIILGFGLTILSLFFANLCLDGNLLLRFQTIFSGLSYSTNAYRVEVWLSCLTMIKENLFTGIGLGTEAFRQIYALYSKPGFEALSAYSIYLEYLVESGLLALVLFLNLIFNSFNSLKSLYYRATVNNDTELGKIILVLLCVFLGVFIQGFVDTLYFRLMVQLVFWLLLGSLSALDKSYLESEVK